MLSDPIILHAEDDEDDAFLFQMALEKAGVMSNVISVPDGETAIAYLSGAPPYADRIKHPLPSVLVTDLKMPRVSGFDVLTWIQRQMHPCRFPIIVFSSSAQESDIKRALDLGARAYWVKPTSFKDLVDLARALNDSWLSPVCHA